MTDLVVGIGLVLVIEGLIWALVPDLGARLLQAMAAVPQSTVRYCGWSCVGVGMLLVWLVRG